MRSTARKPRGARADTCAGSRGSAKWITTASANSSTRWRPGTDQHRRPMLQIIVPLGGAALRFQERGYTFPKPLIEIGNQSMIELVLRNLAPPKPYRYTFICRKEHLA